MFETYYKKGRQAYVIELLVEKTTWLGPGTGEVSLVPLVWNDGDGSIPMTFKSREAATKYLNTKLLNGESVYKIAAFSIKRMTLTVPRSPKETTDE